MNEISITFNGKPRTVAEGLSVEQLIGKEQAKSRNPVVAASINNEMHSLSDVVHAGDVVNTYDLRTLEGTRIYTVSLSMLLVKAARESMNARVRIKYSVGEGIFCQIEPSIDNPFELVRLERAMYDLVEQDLPIKTFTLPREEAKQLLFERNEPEALRFIKYRQAEDITLYELGDMLGVFTGVVVPSTAYLHHFALTFSGRGFMLLFPQRSEPESDLAYIKRAKLEHVFEQSEEWTRILECADAVELNDTIGRGDLEDFIRLNEALHEKMLARTADKIVESGRRVVLIAGPSSSGKTTFSQRLMDQLRVNGKKPVMISLDNYYRDRDVMPIGEDGKPDFEHIDTLDLTLFNEQVVALLRGDTVDIPRFDFPTGRRADDTRPLTLREDGIILFEGIHGLNDLLTPGIGRQDKFKIYISALTQLNLGRHNRIPTTDVRCLRRIVRDHQFRGTSADRTLDMWPSVRAGERRWIFPFQEQCDVMFNSALIYELPYLKMHAEPLLREISRDSEHYIEAQRLLIFLSYFLLPTGCDEDAIIPRISILREFIGGGCFEH